MMQFVKLENGRLMRCPKSGKSGNLMHTNLPRYYDNHPDIAYADGWKELVAADKPDGAYIATYTEDGNAVVQSWQAVETGQAEVSLDDKVDELSERMEVAEGALLELADEVYKEN